MESTDSVSKGVFLFTNGFKKAKSFKKKSKPTLLQTMYNDRWYKTFKHNWSVIETQLQDLHEQTYSALINDIVHYVKTFDEGEEFDSLEGIIPSATLLTGVNQPDHINQFLALINKIREEITPHVAMVNSQDAQSIKHVVESSVWQLIHGRDLLDNSADAIDESTDKIKLKKNQCTMKTLHNWYQAKYMKKSLKKSKSAVPKKTLVIIIPDFESFNCNILQDFVMIISSYAKCLPIVLIFGVATSVSALHKSFPYHVSSKLLIKVFHSHPSHVYMNQVLENIFLSPTSPFHLSGKAFELLTDVFLFYDFSVTGLIQSIKYCMIDHFYGDNTKSLCCSRNEIEDSVMNLMPEDLENIRQLLSFRPFLEAQDCETKIGLFEDDNFFRDVLSKEINKLHDYVHSFYMCIRLLSAFVKDLPKNIFGKTVREIYAKCSLENITNAPAFRESMQLLQFQSQLKLVESIRTALKEINTILQTASPVKPLRSTPLKNNINITLTNDLGHDFAKNVRIHLMTFLRQIENANNESSVHTHVEAENGKMDIDDIPGNRYKLKEKLLKATRVEKIQSEFEMIRSRFVSYLEEVFSKGLHPPHTQTFHEILFFGDVSNIKKQIVGSPRGALHTALSNPIYYLQCSCCLLPSVESISDSLPDVCIAYKLHRECGKHINLYDWLQAFAAILRPEQEDEDRYEDVSVQVRFTRAVSELQFLGFIKSSKRKTDHVMRLTW